MLLYSLKKGQAEEIHVAWLNGGNWCLSWSRGGTELESVQDNSIRVWVFSREFEACAAPENAGGD